MRDVRRVAQTDPTCPPVLFVYQGTVADGAAFFGQYWTAARAVADLAQRLYRAFGIGPGGARQLFGPGVWVASLRAALKGNGPGRTTGDPRLMPGIFLVRGEQILWGHTFQHAGDHPDFAGIPGRLAAARTGPAPPSG